MGWIEAQFRTLKKPNAGSRDGQGDHHHLGNLNRTNIDQQPLRIDYAFGGVHNETTLVGRLGEAHLVAYEDLKIDVASMVDGLLVSPTPAVKACSLICHAPGILSTLVRTRTS